MDVRAIDNSDSIRRQNQSGETKSTQTAQAQEEQDRVEISDQARKTDRAEREASQQKRREGSPTGE